MAPKNATRTKGQIQTPPTSQSLSEDKWAFDNPVETDKEFISTLPAEIIRQILDLLVFDHDSNHNTKLDRQGDDFEEHPHVFLSLAAMNRYLYNHVEAFCEKYLLARKQWSGFRATGLARH